jgi:hypothetical protein
LGIDGSGGSYIDVLCFGLIKEHSAGLRNLLHTSYIPVGSESAELPILDTIFPQVMLAIRTSILEFH